VDKHRLARKEEEKSRKYELVDDQVENLDVMVRNDKL